MAYGVYVFGLVGLLTTAIVCGVGFLIRDTADTAEGSPVVADVVAKELPAFSFETAFGLVLANSVAKNSRSDEVSFNDALEVLTAFSKTTGFYPPTQFTANGITIAVSPKSDPLLLSAALKLPSVDGTMPKEVFVSRLKARLTGARNEESRSAIQYYNTLLAEVEAVSAYEAQENILRFFKSPDSDNVLLVIGGVETRLKTLKGVYPEFNNFIDKEIEALEVKPYQAQVTSDNIFKLGLSFMWSAFSLNPNGDSQGLLMNANVTRFDGDTIMALFPFYFMFLDKDLSITGKFVSDQYEKVFGDNDVRLEAFAPGCVSRNYCDKNGTFGQRMEPYFGRASTGITYGDDLHKAAFSFRHQVSAGMNSFFNNPASPEFKAFLPRIEGAILTSLVTIALVPSLRGLWVEYFRKALASDQCFEGAECGGQFFSLCHPACSCADVCVQVCETGYKCKPQSFFNPNVSACTPCQT